MLVQYLTNNIGEKTGVYLPINDWFVIRNKLQEINFEINEQITKDEILSDLEDAFHEVKQHQLGKIKMQTAKEYFDEI